MRSRPLSSAGCRAEQSAGDLALIARRFGCDAAALGNALDQVLGDLVFLTLHAATPEMAERASVIARVRLGSLGVVGATAHLAAGDAGWVVYARLDLRQWRQDSRRGCARRTLGPLSPRDRSSLQADKRPSQLTSALYRITTR